MGTKESDFRKRLLSTFKVEAQDHIKTISSGLVELEQTPDHETQAKIVETIYRDSHSLKGAARAVNLTDIETICQSLESIFAVWKQGIINRPPEVFDAAFRAIDTIRAILASLESGQASPEKSQISKLLQELSHIGTGKSEERKLESGIGSRGIGEQRPERSEEARHTAHPSETVRISTAKLGSLLLQTEELITAKQIRHQYYAGIRELIDMLALLKNECAKTYCDVLPAHLTTERKNGGNGKRFGTPQSAKLQEFFNWAQTHIKSMEGKFAMLTKTTRLQNKLLDRMVDNLLDDMKKVIMLPFSTLLEGFPLLVRNISHEQGKEVEFVMRGEGVEIDRRILEEMKDPLIHLLRNSIDHGIETPEARMANRKPRRGVITINISPVNENKVEILISDDGAGIDIAKVKEAAVKNGVISQMEAEGLNERETISFIFHSGISTSPIITDISGRGLGLAIVREKVESLGGSISTETGAHVGTRFRILLPLTIATFRGTLVRLNDCVFIIPTVNIEKAVRIAPDEIKMVENRETITINDRPVSFVRLESVLGLSSAKKKSENSKFAVALVLNAGGKYIAFGVDKILEEQDILVKNLGKHLSRVRNIAGAAVLGSGRPVPILNVPDLMRSAVKASAAPAKPASAVEERETEKKFILVVEDSITSRILLKNILESAGYNVKTAVDGIDAITMLKTEDFNLIVSDIDMPRMNGFDLTAKIRDDKKLADMPVVLVTALETRDDRERGINAGANAYIVKSDFNQSNLLEVVRRLI